MKNELVNFLEDIEKKFNSFKLRCPLEWNNLVDEYGFNLISYGGWKDSVTIKHKTNFIAEKVRHPLLHDPLIPVSFRNKNYKDHDYHVKIDLGPISHKFTYSNSLGIFVRSSTYGMPDVDKYQFTPKFIKKILFEIFEINWYKNQEMLWIPLK